MYDGMTSAATMAMMLAHAPCIAKSMSSQPLCSCLPNNGIGRDTEHKVANSSKSVWL